MGRRPRGAFYLRRMASARVVLAAAAVAAASASAFTCAAADFATAALPQAAHRLLAGDDVAIALQGALSAPQAARDARAIRRSLRRAFGAGVPLRYDSARWSDQLGLPGGRRGAIPLLDVGAFSGVRAHADLVAGAWPGPPLPGQPVPAAALAAVAARLRLSVGQVVQVRDTDTGARAALRLTGVVRPRDPGSPYWRLDIVGPTGASGVSGFVTYGPLIVDPAAFATGRLAAGQASWVAVPDLSGLEPARLGPLASRIRQAAAYLSQSQALHGLAVDTGMPALLAGLATNLVVARSMLAILTAELLLLAGAALSLAARLLASERAEESALLRARGGSRWQLARISGAETALLCVAAVGAGAALGGPLAGLLAGTGPLRAAGLRMPAAPSAVSWWAAAGVFAVCAAVLLWPAIRSGRSAPPAGRRGRQSLAGVLSTGGDVALVSLALLAGWQLRRYSAVAPRAGGGLGVDPVLVVAPALALAGGTVALLRLLPLAARAAERAAARGARLGAALPGWQISRRPLRASGPALLVTLAAATATLAIAQHQSSARSSEDQAAFRAGADLRLDSATPVPLGEAAAIASAPGVTSAMPVARLQTSAGQALALDARRADATVLLRGDLVSGPPASLWRKILPSGAAPGQAMPSRARRLAVTAVLRPPRDGMGPASVTLTAQDGSGDTYQIPAGALPADGRPHVLVARLPGRAIAPLRLVAISVQYAVATPSPAGTAAFAVTGLAASSRAAGPVPPPFASGSALARWAATATALLPQAAYRTRPAAFLGWRAGGRGGAAAVFFPGYVAPPPRGSPAPLLGTLNLAVRAAPQIPAIATRSFLSATHRQVGALVPVSLGTASFEAKVVAAVAGFPTVSGPGGALVVDQGSLQDVLAAAGSIPAPVSEWWLSARPGARPRLPPGATVTSRADLAAALRSDPLSAGPQQALSALTLAAAALAVLGLAVSVAASVRERRAVSALLAALGVSRAAQARMLCLEQLALSGPAALAGVALGALLAALLVPAVTLTAAARAPMPPALIVFAWPPIIAAALVVAVAPAAFAAASVARRPDPAAALRAAEAAT